MRRPGSDPGPFALGPRTLIGLVDQSHGPRPVMDADRRRRALLPAVERIAYCGEIGRGNVGARDYLVALGGGELHDPVFHGEDGVAAGEFPLTVGAVARKRIADFDGAEDATRRAEHHRGIVLDGT